MMRYCQFNGAKRLKSLILGAICPIRAFAHESIISLTEIFVK